LDEALVVDIGGTTTDIAVIQEGQVTVSEEGATVGDYKTSVKAANLLSIALGGDSHITVGREKEIAIGPERVVPLAYLASQHPPINDRLKALSKRTWTQATPEWLEHWFLLREPDDRLLETAQEKSLVDLLRGGPRPVPEIVKHLNLLHVAQIGARELLRQEIIGKSGLTPTDLLHIEGRYAPWDVEAATFALAVFSRFQFQDPSEIHQRVWTQMTEAVVHAVVTFLSGKVLPPPALPNDNDMGRWFFSNSLKPTHPQLETSFTLRQPIIGIGAPAGIFLKDVAHILHTDLILPEHHQVANAVGAIAGSVMVTEEILVYPRMSYEGLEVIGYYVQSSHERQEFEGAEEALAHARALSQERALGAALRSGADNPQVTVEELTDGLDTYRIRARAVGNPRLTR
jgi:N-methylhydantoinase A/oxoprolinase/acetone carboxylase beta subunit